MHLPIVSSFRVSSHDPWLVAGNVGWKACGGEGVQPPAGWSRCIVQEGEGCLPRVESPAGHYHALFLRSRVLAHTGAPVIVLSYEGAALDLDKPVPVHLHRATEEALEALHAAGAAHCDVNISKFVVNGDAVRLVDFERLALNATEEQKNGDMWAFDALLP